MGSGPSANHITTIDGIFMRASRTVGLTVTTPFQTGPALRRGGHAAAIVRPTAMANYSSPPVSPTAYRRPRSLPLASHVEAIGVAIWRPSVQLDSDSRGDSRTMAALAMIEARS